LLYDYQLSEEDGKLIATIYDPSDVGGDSIGNYPHLQAPAGRLNPQTKSFSEGNVANLAFANLGADMTASIGMANAVQSAKAAGNNANKKNIGNSSRVGTFAAASFGKSRYETGSHIDVSGFSIIGGFAVALDSSFTLGAFAEYGNGTYNSFNGFTEYDSVAADGKTNYVGGGLLAHYLFQSGAYLEGSVRAGQLSSDYQSGDFLGLTSGQIASFETSSMYVGGHFGIGYVATLGASKLDGGIKYLATLQQGTEAKVSTGETIEFDSVLSQRVRAGAKLTIGSSVIRPYVGASGEYEFGGIARASVFSREIDTPMLSGATGIGEAGLAIETNALSLSLGGEGYVGVRQGFGGTLSFKYRF
jgi:hypothetical protein